MNPTGDIEALFEIAPGVFRGNIDITAGESSSFMEL